MQNNELYIYVASVNRFKNFNNVPEFVKRELDKIKNDNLKDQKRSTYGLLDYAYYKENGYKADLNEIIKDERGKPKHKKFYVSFSHTKDLVAIAISDVNVGIDIEEIKPIKIFCEPKKKLLANGETVNDFEEATLLWTKKEAAFKFDDSIDCFTPSKIDVQNYSSRSYKIINEGKEFYLSVVARNTNKVKIEMIDGKICKN